MFSQQSIFKKNNIKWIILFLLLFITFFSSLFMGRYTISPENTFIVLINALQGNIAQDMNSSIILGMRLPRTLLSMLLGAGLAIAGSTYQGIFRNPLVSPDVLGVSSGAGFGSVLGILLFGMSATTSILAFVFGLGSVFLTYLFARARGQTTMMSLVLSGMIVSAIFAALISLVKYVADPYDALPAITYWLMGSFSKATFEDLRYIFIPLTASLAVLNLVRWRINILSLGEEESKSLGVNPTRIKFIAIIASTVLTALSVTVVGIVGWVGLVIPHITRLLFGVDHKVLLPASCFIGAIFLTVVDIVSRSVTSAEIPIGIITALLGAPFFGFLLKYTNQKGDW